MTHAYKRVYYVAFDPDNNAIAHSADEFECVKKAAEISDQIHVLPATRMNDRQFFEALNSIKPNDEDFYKDIGFNFCGRLIYQCNGFLFDQYGQQDRYFEGQEVRFTPVQ